VVGCPNVTDVQNATVVRQTPRFAAVACRKEHVVPDRLTPWLAARCLANNRWDQRVPVGCASLSHMMATYKLNYSARALLSTVAGGGDERAFDRGSTWVGELRLFKKFIRKMKTFHKNEVFS
jgi:hypothetical protein